MSNAVSLLPGTEWRSSGAVVGHRRTDGPGTEFLSGLPITALLRMVAQSNPERCAFYDSTGETSFGTFWTMVCRIAEAIAAHPVTAGAVGLLLPASAAYSAAIFACVAAGRVCVPLDLQYPHQRNADIAAATGVSLVLTQNGSSSFGPAIATLDVSLALARDLDGTGLLATPLKIDDPAFILCTSGSTGRPKAIVHSQRSLLNGLSYLVDTLRVRPGDRVLIPLSIAVYGGFYPQIAYPLAGATTKCGGLGLGGLRDFMDTMIRRQITILRAGPSLLRSLCQLPGAVEAFRSVRVINIGGEALLKTDLELMRRCIQPGCEIYAQYAATEFQFCSTWSSHDPEGAHPARVSSGTITPGTSIMLLNEDGSPCAPGEAGELVLRSRQIAIGEWEDGHFVPGRMQPDPHDPSMRIFRTGDIAEWSGNGVLLILGRADRMVKVNGQRVEPAELETTLTRLPGVRLAAVVARQLSNRVILLAFVVPDDGADEDLAGRLRQALREKLPAFMVPSRIRGIESIPTLPEGKRNEAALLAIDADLVRSEQTRIPA